MSSAEIVVVKYNNRIFEEICIAAVGRFTSKEHKLTVIDNFEPDRNLGALWNDLIKASEKKYVCLLNSDTEVTEGWLDRLCEAADKTGADAVGPMTNKCGIAFQVGQATPEYQMYRCKTLSGFCLLLRKEAWERVKGFREDFSFYGQESNMLDRLEKLYVRKDVFVKHVGAASISLYPDRQAEDKALGLEQYHRNRKFDFSKRLLVIGSYPGNPFPLWRGIEQAQTELTREGMDFRYVSIDASDDEKSELIDWNPHCVILVSTHIGKIAVWKKTMPEFKCPTCLWWNDLRPGSAKTAIQKMFHHIFLCYEDSKFPYGWEAWRRSTKSDIRYMPQGSVIHPQLYNGERLWHSLFIGNVMNLNGYHDDRWKFLEKFSPTVINECGRNRRAAVEKKSGKLYRQSMLCWVLSPPVTGYNSLRLYNVLAYGGLALVKTFPGLDRLFRDRQHLIVFDGAHQAEEALRKYASSLYEAEKIRKAGWRRQQVKHTVLYRLQNIMSNALGWDDDFWGWL